MNAPNNDSDAEQQLQQPFQQQARSYHQQAARDDIVESLTTTAALLRRLADKVEMTSQSVRNGGDLVQVEETVDALVRSIGNWHLLQLMASLVRYFRQNGDK